MKLFINGVDISKDEDVRITECLLDDYGDGFSNTLQVKCADPESLWSSWGLKCGDTIAVEGNDGFASGAMTIAKIIRANQSIRIIARSAGLNKNTTRYKKWESVRFNEIGNEIAGRLGLSFENYGVTDNFYEELIQNNESDPAFFSRLCLFESAGMLIYDGKLVAYDKASMEKEAVAELEFSVDGIYEITDSIADEYSSCTLKWIEKPLFEEERFIRFISKDNKPLQKNESADPQSLPGLSMAKTKSEYIPSGDDWYRGEWYPQQVEFEGSASAPADSGAELYTDQIRVTSDGQAARWAKGLLRYKNEKRISGSFTKPLLGAFSAGTVVSLSFSMSPDLNGNYFIDRIFHNYKANRSTAYVHKCLGW